MAKLPNITNIESLIRAVDIAKNKFSGQVWWRGQRDYKWDLAPSVFRKNNARNEKSAILRFQHKSPSRYQNVPKIEERGNWLFLMQHHNLPTRLLDWTESPLIATFFGAEIDNASIEHPNEIKDTDGSLYAFSPYILNEFQVKKRKLLMPNMKEAEEIIACAFEKDKPDFEKVIAIRPAEIHPRLLMQLSVFTLHGNNKLMTELPGADKFFIKFKIPKKSKNNLKKELKQLGIRLSNIFPDLDNLAKDIKSIDFKNDNEYGFDDQADSVSPFLFPILKINSEEKNGESTT